MIYLKWKLSQGTTGTGPEATIVADGGTLAASAHVDADGYRVGYASDDANLRGGDWDITEISEADALTFVQGMYAVAVVLADGRISDEKPDEFGDPPE